MRKATQELIISQIFFWLFWPVSQFSIFWKRLLSLTPLSPALFALIIPVKGRKYMRWIIPTNHFAPESNYIQRRKWNIWKACDLNHIWTVDATMRTDI